MTDPKVSPRIHAAEQYLPGGTRVPAGLHWTYFQTGLDDLFRTPALIWGPRDSILIDSGFTLETGRRLATEIVAAGKTISRIFITCADPDYYFGLAPIKAAFPSVQVLATETTVRAIRDSVEHKIKVWSPRLGDNGPKTLSDVVIPEIWPYASLDLDGSVIEIIAAKQPNRFHLWVPSISTILGGVQVVSGIHVWMADTPAPQQRAQWVDSLDAMLSRPLIDALPGHMTPGSATGVAAIRFTKRYLADFESELAGSADATALICKMKKRCPDLAMGFVLDLGATVCMGEAQWP